MKLSLYNCTFVLNAGKFLGFLVSNRGIEEKPEKIKAIMDMQPPKIMKDVQKLTGHLAALRRFTMKLADRCLPFFETLKGATKTKTISWNEECQKAFEDMKKYLSSPPLLAVTAPMSHCLYICLTHTKK